MHRNIKRAITVCTVGALGLSLTACSDDGSEAGGVTEITMLSRQPAQVIDPVIEAFEAEHPDIRVTVTVPTGTAGADYANALQTRIAGNQTPDVFQILTENRDDIVNNGVALDLTGMPVLDTVEPSWLAPVTSDDGVFGITFTAWMGGLIYNRDLLAEAGYDTIPETWDEFVDFGKALLDAGVTPYLEEQQISSGSLTALLASAFNKAGIPSGEWAFDGKPVDQTYAEAWTPVIAEWQRAFDAGVIPTETIGLDGSGILNAFLNGEVAMIRSGSWHQSQFEEAGINFGFAPFPAISGGKTFINGGGDPFYAISASSSPERQAAAKTFLEFLGSEAGVQLLVEGQGAMSISSAYTSDPGDVFRAAYEGNLKTGQAFWIEWSKSANAMVAAMTAQQQLLIKGEATPESFALAMDAASGN